MKESVGMPLQEDVDRPKSPEEEKAEGERSLKYSMYISIFFVGGGLALFWLILFVAYSIRV